jgi:hypothetical protein
MVSLPCIPSHAVVLMYVGSEVIEVTSSPEPEGGHVFLSLIFVALLMCVLAHSSLCSRETLHYTS